jgi:hypothetical protein
VESLKYCPKGTLMKLPKARPVSENLSFVPGKSPSNNAPVALRVDVRVPPERVHSFEPVTKHQDIGGGGASGAFNQRARGGPGSKGHRGSEPIVRPLIEAENDNHKVISGALASSFSANSFQMHCREMETDFKSIQLDVSVLIF